MTDREAEMVDVEIVLKHSYQNRAKEALTQLQDLSVQIADFDERRRTIEARVPANRLSELRHLDCVNDVRTVFTYEPEPEPPNDTRHHGQRRH